MKDYIADYMNRGCKNICVVNSIMNHLTDYFGNIQPVEVGNQEIEQYKTYRINQGVKGTTINQEITIRLFHFPISSTSAILE